MNRIKYTVYYTLMFLLFVGNMCVVSCKEAELDTYKNRNALYFPTKVAGVEGVDSAYVSFSHYPGSNDLRVPYRISLIGEPLKEDTEYKVMVVDSLTTASPEEYSFDPVLKFKKGVVNDSLWVIIHKSERMKNEDVRLVVTLVENENFDLGYYNQRTIKLRFDDNKVKPLWWTLEIEQVYFGKYSSAKFDVFYAVSHLNTIVGLAPWQIRNIGLDMKKYIAEKGTTEEDGDPMIIPVY